MESPRPYDLTEDMDDDYYINAPGRRRMIAAGRSDERDGQQIPLWPPAPRREEMDRGEEAEPRQEEGIVSECLRGLCPDENHPHSEGGTRYKRFRNRRTKRRRNRRTRRRR